MQTGKTSQESLKFMRHSRRTRLKVDDLDYALKVRNVEVPIFKEDANLSFH